MLKIYNVPMFNVDSIECPKPLKIVIRKQIQDLFSLRIETINLNPTAKAVDLFIDDWWTNHRNIIRAASIRPEFNWSTLSLNFDENVMRPVNLYEASLDFLILLARPHHDCYASFFGWNFSTDVLPEYEYDYPLIFDETFLGKYHLFLYKIFVELFKEIILEGKVVEESDEFTSDDAYVSKTQAEFFKNFIDENLNVDKKSKFCKTLLEQDWFSYEADFLPFNKLAKTIFTYVQTSSADNCKNFYDNFDDFITDNFNAFKADVYKHIGCQQISNDKGPLKTTLCNKLVKLYYEFLTACTYGMSGNPLSISATFEDRLVSLKNAFDFYSPTPFKVRNSDGEGFTFVKKGSFEQIFARLQENVKGCLVKQSFIVSFHPCDMITCSLGYNWSSCQSFVNIFTDLPRNYGQGSSYSGMYNRGNFQFASANCFIAYIPYEKRTDLPQYLWAKLKRCLIWVGNNLDCMRQNYFYPGRPSDQESLALAKVIREYIQDVVAPFNFSNGTIDWKSNSSSVRYCSQIEDSGFEGINEIACTNNGVRYDDPILRVAYLKTANKRSFIYAKDFNSFGKGNRTNVFGGSQHDVCPICGKKLADNSNYCSTCSKQLIIHNNKKYHPLELVHIVKDDKDEYYTIDELDKLNEIVIVEDGTAINFKNAFKVHMPSGIKYFKKLPDYVKQCKICGEYFHHSLMIGDVCIYHVNTVLQDNTTALDFSEVVQSFLNSSISFSCNDTVALEKLLQVINDNVLWISGKKPIEYVPTSKISKGKYLYCSHNKLQLTCQAKTAVVELSKLLERRC